MAGCGQRPAPIAHRRKPPRGDARWRRPWRLRRRCVRKPGSAPSDLRAVSELVGGALDHAAESHLRILGAGRRRIGVRSRRRQARRARGGSRGVAGRRRATAAPRHLRRCAAGDSRQRHTLARLRDRRGVAGSWQLHAGTAGAAARRERPGVRRVQHAPRGRLPEGTSGCGADRPRWPGLTAAARLAGHLPDPRRLSPVPDGRIQETAAGLRDRRRVARLPPQPRELGDRRPGHAGHLLLRSMRAAVPGRHGHSIAGRDRRPSARHASSRPIARPGSAGGSTCSRTGSGSSAPSPTRRARQRCWAPSTMRGATRT